MNALFPLMSYYYLSSKSSLRITFEKSFKYLFILGLPISVGITLLADNFIILFYGQQFSNSVIVLQILAWDVLLIFLCKCSSFLFVSTEKQNQMALIIGFVALINIVLNLFLIPIYSYVGAAIATIAAESFLLLVYVYLNYRSIFKISYHKIIAKPIVACGIMGGFIYYFKDLNLILLITISIGIYFGLLYLLKGISDDDISLFKRLIKK
jgi:O-antigen/teichoic acid export membrane protein